jgi:FkbM family methyltransferase
VQETTGGVDFVAMTLANRLRRAVDKQIDAINLVAARSPPLARWQRERFMAAAPRFASVLGVTGEDGTQYLVSARDATVGRLIGRHGHYDVQNIQTVLAVLSDRGICIDQLLDIGANIGTTTVEVLKRLPSATCVAFEPEPRNFALLQQNILANGLNDRVTAHRCALSDRSGELEFELSPDNFGDHRVRLTGSAGPDAFGEAGRSTISVPSRTLDQYLASGDVSVSPHTLIYMDVQGHEGHVLAGARTALSRSPVIAMEYWPYGLERASARGVVSEILAPYESLLDVTQAPRDLQVSDLGLFPIESIVELLALGTYGA